MAFHTRKDSGGKSLRRRAGSRFRCQQGDGGRLILISYNVYYGQWAIIYLKARGLWQRGQIVRVRCYESGARGNRALLNRSAALGIGGLQSLLILDELECVAT